MFERIFPIGLIALEEISSLKKKHIELFDVKNAISPFLNSFLPLSTPVSIAVST
ncbi:MAG: hypothetical protein NPMRIOTA_170012 [Nitrosopumilales archaeon]|nr:MAG: hypothetical protein NPMRIOTA_170012 [Nitrosopumilales archaeon]